MSISHLKNTNLVEVPVWFPDVYPLLCKNRISDPTKPALDVEELAHIPGPKENVETNVVWGGTQLKTLQRYWITTSYPSVSMAYLYFVPSSLSWSQATTRWRTSGNRSASSTIFCSTKQQFIHKNSINITLISEKTLSSTNLCYSC